MEHFSALGVPFIIIIFDIYIYAVFSSSPLSPRPPDEDVARRLESEKGPRIALIPPIAQDQ